MTGHFDLRYDRNKPLASILNDLSYVLLRVIASMPLAAVVVLSVAPGWPADHRFFAPGAHLSQPRVPADRKPPSLVIGQVPMENVHFVERQEIDELLDEFLGHEVA